MVRGGSIGRKFNQRGELGGGENFPEKWSSSSSLNLSISTSVSSSSSSSSCGSCPSSPTKTGRGGQREGSGQSWQSWQSWIEVGGTVGRGDLVFCLLFRKRTRHHSTPTITHRDASTTKRNRRAEGTLSGEGGGEGEEGL
uniref:Uncharacterized protein n=1 Tax=Chromera velia CCMP2878 TaxID=1169474 RepID=A0A0G4I4Z6_9ALVE|eukprot:Cvel_11049.t1-p1 / transcript=Cvel_11049.t1 / gene=Cvel_11049 / organism=Chromera_velia_CCMP2878 / gene_product=hypothetical protein / transcript_product=hypothetical protein / location=Cvel_scaffold681:41613-42029(+) / protein_length=139 / sequence_SO=supercontig / SO=protein_coding / is_pseudo=false